MKLKERIEVEKKFEERKIRKVNPALDDKFRRNGVNTVMENSTRKECIESVLSSLKELWLQNPTYKFWQLIELIQADKDLFYQKDEITKDLLESLLKSN
jgi:hypothetical protein